MSRSGYIDDEGDWYAIMYRGTVKSALRGKRGQAFLHEMLAAMDALTAPRLIANELVQEGEACAIGTVAMRRGIDVTELDPEDYERVAATFGIAKAMAREIAYENDEAYYGPPETPEQRFQRVRAWIVSQITPPPPPQSSGAGAPKETP